MANNDPDSAFALATVDPTWKQAIRVWWLFQWRVLAASIVLGLLIGGLIGFMLGIFGASRETSYYVSQTVRFAIYSFVTLYFIKDILDRDFWRFELA
jgi:uncharacterized membrane protein YraQ (UPF0718 family)